MGEAQDRKEHGALDGSAGAAERLLAELAALAGQEGAGPPVLELLVGEIVTLTSVQRDGACLMVSARLPPCDQAGYLPAGTALQARLGCDGIECRWHADEGCYVAVRSVPLATLRDEPGLMDAILDTADAAREWHDWLNGPAGPSA